MCRCGVVIHVQRAVDYVVVDPNGCGIGIDQQVAADCIADATLGGRPADFDWAGVFLHLQIAIDLGAANRTLGEASGQAVDLQIAADCRAGAESECARSGYLNIAAHTSGWTEDQAAAILGNTAVNSASKIEASAVDRHISLDLAKIGKRAILVGRHAHIAGESAIENAVASLSRAQREIGQGRQVRRQCAIKRSTARESRTDQKFSQVVKDGITRRVSRVKTNPMNRRDEGEIASRGRKRAGPSAICVISERPTKHVAKSQRAVER